MQQIFLQTAQGPLIFKGTIYSWHRLVIACSIFMLSIGANAQVDNYFNSNGNLKSPKELYQFGQYKYKTPTTPVSAQKQPVASSGSGGVLKRYPKSQVFKAENGKIGYSDWKGNVLIPAIYDEMGEYSEFTDGSNTVWVKSGGKYGILEYYQKKPVVPIIYDLIKKINPRDIWVKLNGKVGLISMRHGKTVTSSITIPLKYDDMWTFSSFQLKVKQGAYYGLLSISNFKILETEYEDIVNFTTRLILVKKNNKWGLVNNNGVSVFPIVYDKITRPEHKVSWILRDGKWGLLNQEGSVLVLPDYDQLFETASGSTWYENHAIVSRQGKLVYIHSSGKEVPDRFVDPAKAIIEVGKFHTADSPSNTENDLEPAEILFAASVIKSIPGNTRTNNGSTNEKLKQSEAYFEKGNTKDKLEDYRGAINEFDKAIELYAGHEEYFYNRANAKYKLNDFEGALTDYTQSIQLSPLSRMSYSNRGLVKVKIGDFAGAILDYNKALDIDPKHTVSYYARGSVKKELKQFAAAIEDFTQVIALDPQFEDIYFIRGVARAQGEDYTGAILDLGIAIKINPRFGAAYFNRGLAWIMQEDLKAACGDLNMALSLGYEPTAAIIKDFCK